MGDCMDKKNHQESEWWLSVQEKCIYRQNNGEWLQFTQLNFGRLWFSKTPRIVPRPNHFSHRIQVTQRTQYSEVAAKVNTVHRKNVGSTPIHNYTSGIGLSFLALPRHIQQLTGDIPALPTPSLFDFDEPVDLIIATDGSVIFGVAYHGWVLGTKEERGRNGRRNPVTYDIIRIGTRWVGRRSHSSRHTISIRHLEHTVNSIYMRHLISSDCSKTTKIQEYLP
jgi:hypothetical protein